MKKELLKQLIVATFTEAFSYDIAVGCRSFIWEHSKIADDR